jgi:ligand-binding SRPBCC domain-containing protein
MEFPMIEKSTVRLKIKRFGIPTIWNMKIDTLQCPTTITDVMVSGPFKSFRHERVFVAINETTTQMQETLRVVLPFGWLGRLLFPLLKRDMDTMFAYRHQATQYHFLKDSE